MLDIAVMTDTHKLLQTVFPELDIKDIERLALAAEPCVYPEGVDVCHEGEPGDALFIIGSGSTDIIVHAADNQEIVVDTIEGPTYFGEMAMLGATTTRSATIRTRSVCKMLEISHAAFLSITDENPGLLRRLLSQIIGHLRRNDRAVIQALNEKHAELHHAYGELAEQEQLRSQFIATLSHELRTPLTAVQGYLGLMNQGALHGDSMKVAMNSINGNVKTLVSLTNQMMLLYEMFPESPERTRFNLPDVIIEALNEVRDTMQDAETAVMLSFEQSIPMIYADKRLLLLVFRALIENAFKYNPHKAPIEVKAFCAGNGEVAVTVKDNGIGIPSWAHDRIFEPFYRIEHEGGAHLFPGIGVGLTIAKMLTARHNGRILVDSQPGVGSTFTVYLPARQ
jgi:signal transduction histidine kinase